MTNARVEKDEPVGRLGQGWEIAQTTLGYERGGSSLARVTALRRRSSTSCSGPCGRLKRDGRPLIEDPAVRPKLGRICADLEVQRYAALRILSALEKGEHPGPAARSPSCPTREFEKRYHGAGPGDPRALRPAHAARPTEFAGDRHAVGRAGHLGHAFLWSRAGTIYAGSSEIQKNIIGERVLGLPKEVARRPRRKARAMDFAFSDDQQLLHRTPPAPFLDEHCKPAARARACGTIRAASSDDLWKRDGPARLARPRRSRGARRQRASGMVEIALVLEEMGRAAYPGPVLRQLVAGGLGRSPRRQRRRRRSGGCRPSPRARRGRPWRCSTTSSTGIPTRRATRAAQTATAGAAQRREALRAVGPRRRRRPGAGARARRASRCSSWTRRRRASTLDADGRHGPRQPLVRAHARRRAGRPPTRWWAQPGGAGPAARRPAPPRPRSAPPPRCWAPRAAASTWRRATPRCASSSASPSAPSRPSATAAPRCCSRSRTRTPRSTTRPGRSTRAPRTPRVAASVCQVVRERRRAQGVRRGHPGPRRHRLHLGVRPAPLLQARQGAGGALRRRGLPPRADRPARRRGSESRLSDASTARRSTASASST